MKNSEKLLTFWEPEVLPVQQERILSFYIDGIQTVRMPLPESLDDLHISFTAKLNDDVDVWKRYEIAITDEAEL